MTPFRSIAVAAALVALAGCGGDAAPGYASKTDRFRVQFAGEPKVSERTVGGRRSVVHAVESVDGVCSVAVTDLPLKGGGQPELVPKLLASARDDMVRGAGGRLTEDEGTTLAGKYPGRRFRAAVADPRPGALDARIYLVGPKLYQVMAMGTEEYVRSDAATAFLDSFRLTE
ncbi:MAG: hypothetical protein ACKODX_20790 [Gemmata sp.]